jgi:SAM-dependent methyltransferase
MGEIDPPSTPAPETLADTLGRLERERLEADRRYNDALTELDRAFTRVPDLPLPPTAYDESLLPRINESWQTVAPPAGSGLKGRLASALWRLVAPSLQKQMAFNATLVDHLNRNVAAHRDAQRAIESTIALLRDRLAALTAFESRLLVWAQQITSYVDTKDREMSSGALVVNAAVNDVATDLAKRWESLAVRQQRADADLDANVARLTAGNDELRTLIGISQQASLATKRELERLQASAPPRAAVASSEGPAVTASLTAAAAFTPSLDAYKYVGFEDHFRGSQEVIRARLESYLPYFDGASDVLDVGCGRGEFLDLLRARGISARGLDLNPEMVEVCRSRGLDVTLTDAASYLERLPDGSLGGLFAAQVVEHLEPAYLLRMLELAHHALRPGATMVLETLNPACWVAFFESFIRDITHVRPLHPETLQYLVLASGFHSARIEFRSPVPARDRLQPSPLPAGLDAATADLIEAFNANVDKLNARMFTYLDYAIVAQRPH